MHKKLLFNFVALVFATTIKTVKCTNNGEQFFDSPQAASDLENKIVFNSYINVTNASIYVPEKLTVKNESDFKLLDDFEQELLLATNERKGKLCLNNVKRCMEEDLEYHPTLNQLTQYIVSSVPPFDLSVVKGVSHKCKQDTLQYLSDLRDLKLWALKMFDANPKMPSGFLSGNINQLGDFDECLSAQSDSRDIKGQYCLAALQVEIPQSPYLAAIHRLVQSHYAFKSNLNDPGHRVPRFSSIHWAVCTPHSCTPKDVELGIKEYVERIMNGTDLEIKLEVDQSMCQSSKPWSIPWSTILVSGLFITLLIITAVASVYDLCGGETRKYLMAFSLPKNIMSLISFDRSANDIEAVHGIRLVNAIMLLVAHKSMAIFFVPYINRTQMSEILGKPWTVLGRAASLYTDPFIMMSGMLTTYTLLRKLKHGDKINVFQEYISRLFRILPIFGALILICTFILPLVNTGPLWNQVITEHSYKCKQYWWRSLLFIHNYFGFKDMCLTHTHHVGIDTQLFFTAPLIVPFLKKWPKRSIFVLVVAATISTIMRYFVTYSKRLSNYVHFGTSIEQLFNTADNMYILPAHRATVYIMGILLGYLLQNGKKIQLTQPQIQIGNAMALLSFCISFFGPAFMGSIDYIYNPRDAAWYAAFAPIFWCLSFAWIIFTSHIGQSTLLGQLFSLRFFLITTRISYALYLVQFPVFFYNIGITRAPETYFFLSKNVDINEFVWIFIYAIALTLSIEMPFQKIRNIMLNKKSKEINSNTKQKIQ